MIAPLTVPMNRTRWPTAVFNRNKYSNAYSCWDPGTAVIHFWLLGGVSRRPQRVTSAGSGGRRDTLRPLPLLTSAGRAATAAAASPAV